MKKILILFLFISLIYSCKKETKTYQLRILVTNQTTHSIKVKLFPKSDYVSGGNYHSSDIILAELKNTEFDLQGDYEMGLYSTSDLTIRPYDLVTKVFDSINVISINGGKPEIKFTPQTVIGCTNNIFRDNSAWHLEIRNNIDNLLYSMEHGYIEFNDYIFEIRNN